MKRTVCLLALVGLPLVAHAQLRIGFAAGPTFASFDDNDPDITSTDSRMFAGFGAVVEYAVSSRLSIRSEPSFVRRGSTLFARDGVQTETTEVAVSYLDVPLLVTASAGVDRFNPYLMAGPVFGLRLKASDARVDGSDGVFIFTADEVLTRSNLTLSVGGGVEYPLSRGRVFIQGRYNYGLSDIQRPGDSDVSNESGTFLGTITVEDSEVKTSDLLISVGLTFSIGK